MEEKRRERKREEKRKRSPSPKELKKVQKPAYTRPKDKGQVIADYPPIFIPKVKTEYNDVSDLEGPVTMVSILRLLSALEDSLGKELGCKVLDLLATALALEKVKGNASEDLLTLENWKFLLRVSDRLKRALWMREIKEHELKACKKALENIDSLEERGKKLEERKKEGKELKVDRGLLEVEVMKALRAEGENLFFKT